MDLRRRLQTAADALAERSGRSRHEVAVVLGSGLGGFARTLDDRVEIPYAAIPGFPQPAVPGHAGLVHSAKVGTRHVMVLEGRVHAYEGLGLDPVTFPIRTAVMAGCEIVILTNAAGGCRQDLGPGDLVLIRDHLDLAGLNPLVGPNDPSLGPRFPDLTDLYDPWLRARFAQVGARLGIPLSEGVYAWFLGPSYETPAEVRMATTLGADLVGMSTVPEAIAARHLGARVAGLSLVTNQAAGLAGHPLSHEEVAETAAAASERIAALLGTVLAEL